jgi:hypothetical protein
VIKQVYHDKKDGRLNKNSDLTLDIKNPIIDETSASSADQIVHNDELVSSEDVVEQEISSAGGQDQKKSAGSAKTCLTGPETNPTGPSGDFGNNPKTKKKKKKSYYISTRRWLSKSKTVGLRTTKGGILPHQRSINGLIGLHRLFRRCMSHELHIQVYPILIYGFSIILGCRVINTNILLMLHKGAMIYMIGHHGRIKISVGKYV